MNLGAKHWAALLVAAVCALLPLAVFTLLEAYLRFSLPSSSGGSIYEFTLNTKRYKVHKKDAAITAWGVSFRTNTLGFRDNKSTIPPKRIGEYRIIVLGDSFTAAAGVEFDEIYTSLLQKALRAVFGDITIINLAVGGYNIIQYALVLEEVGLELSPDMVLVAVFPYNDLSNETYDAMHETAAGKNRPRRARPWGESLYAWLQTLYVYPAYLNKIEWRLRALFRENHASAELQQPAVAKIQNYEALKTIGEITADHGLPVAAVILPNTDDFADQRKRFQVVEQFCQEIGIPYLSLLNDFSLSQVAPSELRLNAVDNHPNKKYNRIVAQHLAPFLTRLIQNP